MPSKNAPCDWGREVHLAGLLLSNNFLLRLRQINERVKMPFCMAVDSQFSKVYGHIRAYLFPCLCMAWGRTAAGQPVAISLIDDKMLFL
jgi:hypothetical protein